MTMREIHCSADRVADDVLALINGRPQTPRRDEIAAIFVAQMNGTPGEIAPAALPPLAEVEKAIAACEAVDAVGEDTDESEHAYGVLEDMEDAIWSAPPTSPAVLRAHALIAKYYHRNNACTVATLGGKPWVKPTDCDMLPDHAIAELIQAVLAFIVIGRAMPTLPTEGRLLTIQQLEEVHHG